MAEIVGAAKQGRSGGLGLAAAGEALPYHLIFQTPLHNRSGAAMSSPSLFEIRNSILSPESSPPAKLWDKQDECWRHGRAKMLLKRNLILQTIGIQPAQNGSLAQPRA